MRASITNRLLNSLSPRERPYEVVDRDVKGFLLRVQPSGAMTYYLSYRTAGGERRRYRIGPAGNLKPMQARDIAVKLAARVAQGVDLQAEKRHARHEAELSRVRTLGGFLELKYGPWVVAERKTGAQTLQRLEAQFGAYASRPLVEINPWVIEKWRSEQLKAGKKPAAVNRDLAALKAALSKAVDWDLLPVHPLARMKPCRVDRNGKVRFLTDDEEESLRGALARRDERIRRERASANAWRRQRGYPEFADLSNQAYPDYLTPLVLLALNTGLRRGELFHLTWTQVDLSNRMLTVSGEKAKSGQTRHIPLNAEAHDALVSWGRCAAGQRLVFPGADGEPLGHIRTAWGGIVKGAGLSEFRFHDLRHTFASKLVMRGVDLNTVRELLGHGDMQMTLRYAHLAPEHKAAAVERLVAIAG